MQIFLSYINTGEKLEHWNLKKKTEKNINPIKYPTNKKEEIPITFYLVSSRNSY